MREMWEIQFGATNHKPLTLLIAHMTMGIEADSLRQEIYLRKALAPTIIIPTLPSSHYIKTWVRWA